MAKNGKAKRTRTPKLMTDPGEIVRGPTVVVCPAPLKEGMSFNDAVTGQKSMIPMWVYNISTWRKETGDWRVDAMWWDSNETGHVVHLPDKVCKTIFRHQQEIIQDAKKIRGQKAFQTAKHNAEKATALEDPRPARV